MSGHGSNGAGDQFRPRALSSGLELRAAIPHPVVHLELQTYNVARACIFYTELFGWRAEAMYAGRSSYVVLDLGERLPGGAVEQEGERPAWLPYVEVDNIAEVIERARLLGGSVVLGPREGPAGWRAVLSAPSGAEVALWQPKL